MHLFRENVKLTERLGTLKAQRASGDLIAEFLSHVRIRSGDFRILKGNIGEILSLPIQYSIYARLGAKLISGVRMRLRPPGSQRPARSVLFTDNIVATKRSGNLHIHAVFEVKSGV